MTEDQQKALLARIEDVVIATRSLANVARVAGQKEIQWLAAALQAETEKAKIRVAKFVPEAEPAQKAE